MRDQEYIRPSIYCVGNYILTCLLVDILNLVYDCFGRIIYIEERRFCVKAKSMELIALFHNDIREHFKIPKLNSFFDLFDSFLNDYFLSEFE